MAGDYVIRRKAGFNSIEYWTGRAWTTFLEMARPYDIWPGYKLIEHRFNKQDPLPTVVRIDSIPKPKK